MIWMIVAWPVACLVTGLCVKLLREKGVKEHNGDHIESIQRRESDYQRTGK